MLRVYFLQQWYGLSGEALEDALYDSMAMRAFAGSDLAVEAVPDAITPLKFRRLLVEHELTRKLFDKLGTSLCERGLMMKEGTIVDATIMRRHRRPRVRPGPGDTNCWPHRQAIRPERTKCARKGGETEPSS
jgi:IS5 family transposase